MSRRAPHIVPGDVSVADAAHRLGLSLNRFLELRTALERRGFPLPDPTTGLYDIDAIDVWRRSRNPHLYDLTGAPQAMDARAGEVERRLRAFRGG